MKYLFISLVILCPLFLCSQYPLDYKRGNIWISGYGNNPPNFGLSKIDFNHEPPVVTRHTLSVGNFETHSSICDTAGQLLFYCNGVRIADRTFNEMQGNPRLYQGDFGGIDGTYNRDACIALPLGDGTDRYYIIYSNPVDLPPPLYIANLDLRFALIDMSLNNGQGGAVFTDSILVRDTINTGGLVACRHANGRDWWVLTTEKNNSLVNRWLVTPYGISSQGKQAIPIAIEWNAPGQSMFSPDGSRFADFRTFDATNSKLNIFDFDRCTGLLSNQLHHVLPNPVTLLVSCSFSPNSKRLYLGDMTNLYQVNLDQPRNQILSTIDTIARYDGFSVRGWPTPFSYHQLAPNNKIYINAGTTEYLHMIQNPDGIGAACDVRQHDFITPTISGRTMPNYPNFRLGPLDGSGCDTLGIDVVSGMTSPTPPKEGLMVYPNPASDHTTISWDAELVGEAKLTLVDILGRVVLEKTIQLEDKLINLETYQIPTGMYSVRLNNADWEQLFVTKLSLVR